MSEHTDLPAELLLIRNEPSCRKCHQVEAVMRDIAATWPDKVSVRVITADDAEAQRCGVLLVPMVLLNGKTVCAGVVPRRLALEKLVAAELRLSPPPGGTDAGAH